jgi:hypothetical protein
VIAEVDIDEIEIVDESTPCRYFQDYGNGGVPGKCDAESTHVLVCYRIPVCEHHAHVITLRYPELGGMERFVKRRLKWF